MGHNSELTPSGVRASVLILFLKVPIDVGGSGVLMSMDVSEARVSVVVLFTEVLVGVELDSKVLV